MCSDTNTGLIESDASARQVFDERVNKSGVEGYTRGNFRVAVAIGVACGLLSFASTFRAGFRDQDFRIFWVAARVLASGGNPYHAIVLTEGGPAFFYPIVAAVVAAPFALVPVMLAGPLFVGLSCGLLALALPQRWRLLGFLSGSMAVFVMAANWSPLLTVAFFLPGAAWLGALKPNIGIALLAYRPSIRSALVMLAVSIVSLIVLPRWPLDWLATVRQSRVHYTPLLAPGGFLLLLALLKWRRPEARLLAAMSILPSSPIIYEAIPLLFVVPENWREMLALCATTTAAYWWMRATGGIEPYAFMERGRVVVLVSCYLPALIMILRRPNRPYA